MKVNGITFNKEEPEIIQVLSKIDNYDSCCEVAGYSDDGVEYHAVGFISCSELVEIEEDTLIKIG